MNKLRVTGLTERGKKERGKEMQKVETLTDKQVRREKKKNVSERKKK